MQVINPSQFELKLPNAELHYIPDFYESLEADTLFNKLLNETNWQTDQITVFGKTYEQPRLTALCAKNNNSYTYSGITMKPNLLTNSLIEILDKIENASNHNFTSVLLNLYRNGNDSNGWHADNEKELGNNPIIASLSLGAERYFHFRHRHQKELSYKLLLKHGSLLIMKGEMQHFWLHQIPKTKQQIGSRINLTFRTIN